MEKHCLLNVRTLLDDERTISDREKTIVIEGATVRLEAVCDNGICVLYAENGLPIFVNLRTNEVIYKKEERINRNKKRAGACQTIL